MTGIIGAVGALEAPRLPLTSGDREGGRTVADSKLIRTFKYRIYPTTAQVAALELQLAETCRLYNAALQERRDAWRMQRKRISFYDQSRQLKDIRAAGDVGIPNFHTAEGVLQRVNRAFDAYFRRMKSGQCPGFPRFKSSARCDTLTAKFGNGAYLDGEGRHRPAYAALVFQRH